MASASENATYWLIAVPNRSSDLGFKPSKELVEDLVPDRFVPGVAEAVAHQAQVDPGFKQALATRRTLDQRTSKMSQNFEFRLPKLRVGTLDALIALSDDVGKMSTTLENMVKKLYRTFYEFGSGEGGEEGDLFVDQKSPHEFVETFEWNRAKYPAGAPLRELVEKIYEDVASTDEDLRKRVNKYNEVHSKVMNIEKKESGSLMVRSLGAYLNAEDVVQTEHLTTMLIVVPSMKKDVFIESYEKLEGEDAEFYCVVPRSAKLLTEDVEFSLFRVVVLKRARDSYANLCREHRFHVRAYTHDPEKEDEEKEDMAKHYAECTRLLNKLLQWCETSFSEVFSAWIHIKAIRLFVESVLRYGIPVNFQAVVLRPKRGQRAKLRKVLGELYAGLASKNMTAATEGQDTDLSGFGGDFFPYVFLPLNLEDFAE